MLSRLRFGWLCNDEIRCTLSYHHGNCHQSFVDQDVVSLPFASRSRLLAHRTPELPCIPFQPLTLNEIIARNVASSLHAPSTFSYDRILRQASAVLTHRDDSKDETDDVALMQRSGHGGYLHPQTGPHDDQSDSRGTNGTWEVSSDGRPPYRAHMHPGVDWLLTVHQARRFLFDYAQANRLRPNADLLVHVLLYANGQTRASGSYCPQWFLQQDVPIIIRFLDWCQEYTMRLDKRWSRMFPAVGELYQNMPTLVVVHSLPACTVPIIVQIIDSNPRNPPFFLVFLARSRERVSRILQSVMDQMEIAPSVFRYNGRQVVWQEELEMVAGGILQVRMLSDEELQNPTTSTEEAGISLTFASHDTWSSTRSVPHQEPVQHTLFQPYHTAAASSTCSSCF